MAFSIISGRNCGYPCIAEISDIPQTVLKPYPELFQTVATDAYPRVPGLPDMPETALSPYPEFLQRCLGRSVNEGYPVIMQVGEVKSTLLSQLFFGENRAVGLYYNGRRITSAYCNDKLVFGIDYFT